jgi:AcrR family transcriptional regulator
MDEDAARTRLLDAAEDLFYARGIQSVGMDAIRNASGVSLKQLYRLFPAKEQLVEAYLERRDVSWRGRLADYVECRHDPQQRLLAVFDWLRTWFSEPGYRGCAWINGYGELGSASSAVAGQARRHKEAFRAYLQGLGAAAGLPESLADQLYLLAEGAIVTAAIFGTAEPAARARAAAADLLAAAQSARALASHRDDTSRLTPG